MIYNIESISLYIIVIHVFSLLYGIPLYDYATIYPFYYH